MKIISPFKDYYDYLSGVYGIDEKIVYVRKPVYTLDYSTYNILKIWVCDTMYLGLKFDGSFVWDREKHQELWTRVETDYRTEWDLPSGYYWALRDYLNPEWYTTRNRMNYGTSRTAPPKNYNTLRNCPIILTDGQEDYFDIRLDKTNIISVLPAQDIYLKIIDFLSYKEPEVVRPADDMKRFESKGFDKKTSFRKL